MTNALINPGDPWATSNNGKHEDFKYNSKRKRAARKAGKLARRARRRNKLHRRGS